MLAVFGPLAILLQHLRLMAREMDLALSCDFCAVTALERLESANTYIALLVENVRKKLLVRGGAVDDRSPPLLGGGGRAAPIPALTKMNLTGGSSDHLILFNNMMNTSMQRNDHRFGGGSARSGPGLLRNNPLNISSFYSPFRTRMLSSFVQTLLLKPELAPPHRPLLCALALIAAGVLIAAASSGAVVANSVLGVIGIVVVLVSTPKPERNSVLHCADRRLERLEVFLQHFVDLAVAAAGGSAGAGEENTETRIAGQEQDGGSFREVRAVLGEIVQRLHDNGGTTTAGAERKNGSGKNADAERRDTSGKLLSGVVGVVGPPDGSEKRPPLGPVSYALLLQFQDRLDEYLVCASQQGSAGMHPFLGAAAFPHLAPPTASLSGGPLVPSMFPGAFSSALGTGSSCRPPWTTRLMSSHGVCCRVVVPSLGLDERCNLSLSSVVLLCRLALSDRDVLLFRGMRAVVPRAKIVRADLHCSASASGSGSDRDSGRVRESEELSSWQFSLQVSMDDYVIGTTNPNPMGPSTRLGGARSEAVGGTSVSDRRSAAGTASLLSSTLRGAGSSSLHLVSSAASTADASGSLEEGVFGCVDKVNSLLAHAALPISSSGSEGLQQPFGGGNQAFVGQQQASFHLLRYLMALPSSRCLEPLAGFRADGMSVLPVAAPAPANISTRKSRSSGGAGAADAHISSGAPVLSTEPGPLTHSAFQHACTDFAAEKLPPTLITAGTDLSLVLKLETPRPPGGSTEIEVRRSCGSVGDSWRGSVGELYLVFDSRCDRNAVAERYLHL